MDVLRGSEVEAVLVALVLQETLGQLVRHLHVAAVVLLCVQRGVGQHGRRVLHVPRVQEGRIPGNLVRLEEGNGDEDF